MKISLLRLKKQFMSVNFRVSRAWPHIYSFVRADTSPDLFLHIDVDFQGAHNEAVYGAAGVGVTKWIGRDADDGRILVELATDRDRQWAIIETTNQAKAWERRLVEVGPRAAEAIAVELGPELLRRTLHARQRSKEHLKRLDCSKPLYANIYQIHSEHDFRLFERAQRLAEWPGVMEAYDAEAEYLLACYAVLTGEMESRFIDQDPLQNEELMWQIQLVADGILSWKLSE